MMTGRVSIGRVEKHDDWLLRGWLLCEYILVDHKNESFGEFCLFTGRTRMKNSTSTPLKLAFSPVVAQSHFLTRCFFGRERGSLVVFTTIP